MQVVAILISYLLGSISFSVLIGKLKGIDIRQHGSGNAGATNTLRVLGKGPGFLVLALDVMKGIAAVWIGRLLGGDQIWIEILCGLAVIIGHNWPVFFRFKGGKGIASTIGVLATLCFWPALFAGIFAILSIAITRYVSLGALIFTFLTPIFLLLSNAEPELIWCSLLIMVFAFYRHRSNIVRLWQRKENKLGAKR
ncbi:glycerol-3-phosphate 1-O-acyltransferase PlsY [Gorillibacterium timonense]|uniref:glycerol-3-phosphate 1-O-acyltransferase PlsY n=1 Tax=Gorillibacterium timonense TaxID=1689269 RepID=UPI00071E3F3D|nr:glycerol-3-phosphate 1-O-acyltransferase PlsY [Gorillibacterium timonense]